MRVCECVSDRDRMISVLTFSLRFTGFTFDNGASSIIMSESPGGFRR